MNKPSIIIPSFIKPFFIKPEWNLPDNVQAMVTTRIGGYSQTPWQGFNLALHVNDKPELVAKNRALLRKNLPAEPYWLEQTHSCRVIEHPQTIEKSLPPNADGSFSCQKNQVCVVMTADCLPLLISNKQGTAVAALHAGWRGLADGIIEEGIALLLNASQCLPADLTVWLGPAIGPKAFEVGEDVRQIFLTIQPCEEAFLPIPGKPGKWLANIYLLAKQRLAALGINDINGGEYCTFTNQEQFYSYRRDGVTGRMASLIWIKSS